MKTFSALLALCAGNSPVTNEIRSQRPVMRSFDLFFDLRLNNRFSKHRNAGDLRSHGADYDVTVMNFIFMDHCSWLINLSCQVVIIPSCLTETFGFFDVTWLMQIRCTWPMRLNWKWKSGIDEDTILTHMYFHYFSYLLCFILQENLKSVFHQTIAMINLLSDLRQLELDFMQRHGTDICASNTANADIQYFCQILEGRFDRAYVALDHFYKKVTRTVSWKS